MGLPAEDRHTLELELADEAATAALAARLAPLLRPGDLVALGGDLGAGKTAFARALINALPGAPEEVPSPTFTLVQLYERGDLSVWHFDLYRLDRADEVWELGLEEALAEGVSLVEWPERLGPQLPRDRLEIALRAPDAEGARRQVRLTGHGRWRARLQELAA